MLFYCNILINYLKITFFMVNILFFDTKIDVFQFQYLTLKVLATRFGNNRFFDPKKAIIDLILTLFLIEFKLLSIT